MTVYTDNLTTSEISELTSSRATTFDWGLLCLRVWFGLCLFLKHGWEKPTTFSQMAAHFPNPLHLGSTPTLVIALISDFVCSILVILGLGTRWAALYIIGNIFVAWGFVHHFSFFTRGAGNGEPLVLYIGGFVTLVIMGAGRFSLDWKLGLDRYARRLLRLPW